PCLALGLGCEARERDCRTRLATEMRQIQAQDAEEGNPAVAVSLELSIPIIGAGEPAVHHAYHAGSAGTSLDGPFRGDLSRFFFGLNGKTLGWIPCPDGCNRLHARTEVGYGGTANALLDGAGNEPRRNAIPGRDRAPDFLGRAWNFHFGLNGPLTGRIFSYRHDGSLTRVACWGQRVCHQHEAVRTTPRGGFIVILGNETVDCFGKLIAEGGPLRGRPESYHRVHGQSRQVFTCLVGAADTARRGRSPGATLRGAWYASEPLQGHQSCRHRQPDDVADTPPQHAD